MEGNDDDDDEEGLFAPMIHTFEARVCNWKHECIHTHKKVFSLSFFFFRCVCVVRWC